MNRSSVNHSSEQTSNLGPIFVIVLIHVMVWRTQKEIGQIAFGYIRIQCCSTWNVLITACCIDLHALEDIFQKSILGILFMSSCLQINFISFFSTHKYGNVQMVYSLLQVFVNQMIVTWNILGAYVSWKYTYFVVSHLFFLVFF